MRIGLRRNLHAVLLRPRIVNSVGESQLPSPALNQHTRIRELFSIAQNTDRHFGVDRSGNFDVDDERFGYLHSIRQFKINHPKINRLVSPQQSEIERDPHFLQFLSHTRQRLRAIAIGERQNP